VCFWAPDHRKQQSAGLSQAAVKFVSYMLLDDIEAVLVKDKSAITSTPVEYLLGWVQLDWQTTARQYEADYDRNEIAADKKFKGKKILLSGIVDSIDKDFKGDGVLTLRGSGLKGVHAQLSDRGVGAAASFSRGQQVNLVCDGSVRVLTVATLDNRESFGDYLKRLSPSIEERVTEFLSGRMTLPKAAAVPVATIYVRSTEC
jgi:hypothetical protein